MTDNEKKLEQGLRDSFAKIKKLRAKVSRLKELKDEPIAIIGMGCRLPGNVNSPEEFWEFLIENKDGIIEIPAKRWDVDAYYDPDKEAPGKMYIRKGGFLQTPVDEFDADFFHISPKEAEDMDPQQRLALEVAYEALENAGIKPNELMHSLTGVYMGICFNDYGHLITESGHLEAVDHYYSTGNHYSVLSGRISYFFGLEGPAISMDTACSSSLVTLDAAVKDLRLKRCNLALAGGVNLMLAPEPTINFCKSGMLSPEGYCKTFDASADGYVRGEGCGIVVLKRLSDAIADKNTILAVIRGTAVNQDGASSGLTVPNGLAQEQVIKAALQNARISPENVSYVEAHGTGTSLGDPIELEALKNSYTKERPIDKPILVGSVKTNIGHTEAVAGVASIIKVVLSLLHEKIPATLHFKKLNSNVDLSNVPLEIATKNSDWNRGEKRLAGISSFGFSGTNAHVILEEGPVLTAQEFTDWQKRSRDTHQFHHRHYWSEAALPTYGKKLASVHPLLGEKYSTPDDEIIYRGELHLSALPYLKDHQVYKHIIYPGAGYLEMMLAAGLNGMGEGRIQLSQVSIEAALSFDSGKSLETQVLMKPTEAGYELAIYSQEQDASKENASWHCHARGAVRIGEVSNTPATLKIEDIKSRCKKIVNREDFYDHINATGIHYGNQFQTLQTIYVGKGEALGELKLAESSKGYLAHPAILDGALQLLLVSLSEEKSKDLYLPVGCDSLEFYAPLGDEVLVHWEETEKTEMGRVGNLAFCTASAKILAILTGMHYRKTTEQALKQMLAHESSVEDWLYEWSWEEKTLESTTVPETLGHWLILSDGKVSGSLGNLFESKGASTRRISSADHPKTKEAFIELLQSENFSGILHVTSTGDKTLLSANTISSAQTLSTKSALHLMQALAELDGIKKIPLFLISQNLFDKSSEFSENSVLHSPLLGLFKSVLIERPELSLKLIDVGNEPNFDLVFQTIFSTPQEPLSYLRHNQFYVPRLLKAKNTRKEGDHSAIEKKIKPDATYLITGGLGGLGLTLAKWLIEKGVGQIVLTGRRMLDDEIKSTLANLVTKLTDITYESIDIGDEKSVANLLGRLESQEKPLKGIFHLAGVLDDATLLEQDWNHFENVFRPKVYGSYYLHQYSKELDLFVMFSSIASTLGNPGQSNYAAANAFMDSLCEYRKKQGLSAHSLSWGPWSEVGMAKTLASRHAKGGFLGLTPKEGMDALEAALLFPQAHLSIAKINWKNYLSQLIETPAWFEAFVENAKSRDNLPAKLEMISVSERFDAVANYVEDVVRAVLSVPASQVMDRKKGFFDMGLDSLMAVELKNRLQIGLGKSVILASTTVFDYSSIDKMTQHLAELLKLDSIKIKKHELPLMAVRSDEPIAIIGMSCRYPGGANNPEEFWRVLEMGIDGICEVPKDRFDVDDYYDPVLDAPGKMYTRNGGFLNVPVDLFDANFFGISPKEAEEMDPQQRLLLEVTWEALEHACIPQEILEGTNTGLYAGIMYNDYSQLITKSNDPAAIGSYFGSGNAFSAAVGRVSYCLGLQGPCMAIDTACSSSLVAINSACESLRLGECHQAIAGGVSLMLAAGSFVAACQAHMLSPDGHCKTFDKSADGYARAEGCGMIVLKRVSDAKRDGDKIYALIRSSGVNHGGSTSGLTVPNGKAQEALLKHVYGEVGLKPDDIDYVEAHGTGTSLGDPIEVRAIGAAYGDRDPDRPLLLGSAKSNIGHTESAAGVAGVIKMILSLNHEMLPANLHFNELNPNIELNFPVKIVTEKMPWKKGGRIRRAGVSSFGFSGVNAHVILEEAPDTDLKISEVEERPLHILTLSAKTEPALNALIQNYQNFLDTTEASLGDICYSANTGRNHELYRIAVIAKDVEELKTKLTTSEFTRGKSQKSKVYEFSATGDWVKDLNELAMAYANGAVVDWKKFDEAYTRQKIALPSYPFQRKSYWAKAIHEAKARSLPIFTPCHPLLGERLDLANNAALFVNNLPSQETQYLAEYRWGDRSILTNFAVVEMMIAAVQYNLSETKFVTGRIDFSKTSFDLKKMATQTLLTAKVKSELNLKIHVKNSESSENDWNLIFNADIKKISAEEIAEPGTYLQPEAGMLDISADAFYKEMEARHLHLGKVYKGISRIHYNEESIYAEIFSRVDASEYFIHPAILTACSDLMYVFQLNNEGVVKPGIMHLKSCEKIVFLGELSTWAKVIIKRKKATTKDDILADLFVYNEVGKPVLLCYNLVYKVIDPSQ